MLWKSFECRESASIASIIPIWLEIILVYTELLFIMYVCSRGILQGSTILMHTLNLKVHHCLREVLRSLVLWCSILFSIVCARPKSGDPREPPRMSHVATHATPLAIACLLWKVRTYQLHSFAKINIAMAGTWTTSTHPSLHTVNTASHSMKCPNSNGVTNSFGSQHKST